MSKCLLRTDTFQNVEEDEAILESYLNTSWRERVRKFASAGCGSGGPALLVVWHADGAFEHEDSLKDVLEGSWRGFPLKRVLGAAENLLVLTFHQKHL